MFKPLELYIGLRYTRAKRRNHFISFISLISLLGIALGVIVLITVLSVMNGFGNEIRDRVLSMASHATVSEYGGNLFNWQTVRQQVADQPRVEGVAPFVEGQAMITSRGQVSGVLMRGVDSELEPAVSRVHAHMKYGELSDLENTAFGIVLGSELAAYLGAHIGDAVTVITPRASVTPAGVIPTMKRFTVVGIFQVDMNEYDRHMAFLSIGDAAKLFRMQDAISGLRVKVSDVFDAPLIARQIQDGLAPNYFVTDWTRHHTNLFHALQMEKTMMFIILVLIVAVAAFNIVSTLVMLVTDKQPDIAILRTMGMSPASVMGVFMVQGMLIGVIGTILGVAGGVALAENVDVIVPAIENFFNTRFLPPDIYYITVLTGDVQVPDVVGIAIVSFLLSFFATLYPAYRASKTEPAVALRYE